MNIILQKIATKAPEKPRIENFIRTENTHS